MRIWPLYYISDIAANVAAIRAILWHKFKKPSFKYLKLKKGEIMDTFSYELGLNAATTDVVTQKLLVSIDGQVEEFALPATDDKFAFSATQGSEVVLTLSYIDDAGNESSSITHTFTVVDTFPPEPPSGFGELKVVSETEG